MTNKRTIHKPNFKAKVALAAVKEDKTSSQLVSQFGVTSGQISTWKKQLVSGSPRLFEPGNRQKPDDPETIKAPLYEEIGRLKMELEWLKKNLPYSTKEKRYLIDSQHDQLSIQRQCELVGLSRSSWYYSTANDKASTSPQDAFLMKLIDQSYTQCPFYGSRRIRVDLQKQLQQPINRKRIQRLMRLMGIHGIAPGPNTSKPHPEHKIYPYLLRDLRIDRPNQVWSTDITFIPMAEGFMYLVAIIDWFSRYVLSWTLSNTMETTFCLDTLEAALQIATPEIFNTDQGSQFTSLDFTGRLLQSNIQISMDGRGRALDNIFVERLWRTVKYEHIYMNDYASVESLRKGLQSYFEFYNTQRHHQALNYQSPCQWYYS
jgi:putative transposase